MTPHEQHECILSWTLWLPSICGLLSFHQTQEWLPGLENSTRASIDIEVSSKWLKFHIYIFFSFLSWTISLRSKESSETKWSSVSEERINGEKMTAPGRMKLIVIKHSAGIKPEIRVAAAFFVFFKGKIDVRQCSLLWTQCECFFCCCFNRNSLQKISV